MTYTPVPSWSRRLPWLGALPGRTYPNGTLVPGAGCKSADQAMPWHHKQFETIITDAGIPVNEEPSMYQNVTSAWLASLESMENLIQGIPQKVHNGAVLLAVSAWHLYPDMLVYRGKDGKELMLK